MIAYYLPPTRAGGFENFQKRLKGGDWENFKGDIGIAHRGGCGIFDMGVGCSEKAIADLRHSHRCKQAIM